GSSDFQRAASEQLFCVVGIFYFQNFRKRPFPVRNVSGRDFHLIARNRRIRRFSISVHLYQCKRELGTISNRPPKTRIRVHSAPILSKRTAMISYKREEYNPDSDFAGYPRRSRRPMTTLPGTTSGLQWKEGTESLLFGELFLGGMASTYLGRGRSIGYGLYFTDQRVIGVRVRLLAQALLAPYLI